MICHIVRSVLCLVFSFFLSPPRNEDDTNNEGALSQGSHVITGYPVALPKSPGGAGVEIRDDDWGPKG